MYKVLLAPGNTEFSSGIARSVGFQSGRLKAALAALVTAQKIPTAQSLASLLTALQDWRTNEPNEYANRGGTNGVAWRLLMETRQMLQNRYHQAPAMPAPQMPPGCPGTLLLGVYVPEGEGHVEICHAFAYRWFIAAGRMEENPALPAVGGAYNAATVPPAAYPLGVAGYPAARVGGVIALQPGDLISMWTVPGPMGGAASLGHSLIAQTSTTWFSANNAGTFGVGTGRSIIDTTQHWALIAGHQPGWIGGTNQWMRPDGVVMQVVYRR